MGGNKVKGKGHNMPTPSELPPVRGGPSMVLSGITPLLGRLPPAFTAATPDHLTM
jgi:hypothetical protein